MAKSTHTRSQNLALLRYWSKSAGYKPKKAFKEYSTPEIARRANGIRRLREQGIKTKNIKNKDLRRGKAATPERRVFVPERVKLDIEKKQARQIVIGRQERATSKTTRELTMRDIRAAYKAAVEEFGGKYDLYTIVINGIYDKDTESESGSFDGKVGTKSWTLYRSQVEKFMAESPSAAIFATAISGQQWHEVYWVSLRPAQNAERIEG